MGAVQFIENLDRTSLTISDAEFEANVEAAVSAIAERHHAEEEAQQQRLLQANPPPTPAQPQHRRMPSPHLHLSEKSSLSRAEVTPRNSLDAERVGPRRSTSLKQDGGKSASVPAPEGEENAAVAGLLRTIQKPLSTIGRIFSDSDTASSSQAGQPASTPQPGGTPRLSPAPPLVPRSSNNLNEKERRSAEQQRVIQRVSAEDAAARQASAEAEEARRIQWQEHRVVVETLAGMFPGLDREIIDDVVRLKEGRYVILHQIHFTFMRVRACGLIFFNVGLDWRLMRVLH